MKKFKIPDKIEPEAKAYIKDVLAMLQANGIIEDVDDAAIKMLAYNYSTFIKASKIVEEEGLTITSDRGNIAEHPAVKIGRDAQTSALKVMAEFGLTAKARTRLPSIKVDDETSPLEEFIKQEKEGIMKQSTKDWIQYSTAIAMVVSAIVIAFLAFIITSTIESGVLIYIAQALCYAGGIFGVSIYFKNKMGEFESNAKEQMQQMMNDMINKGDSQ